MLSNIKYRFSGGKIILLVLLLTTLIYPQWNDVVTTTISESNLVYLENFANKDGIHVVIQRSASSNSILYYRLNSSGTVLTSTVIESGGGAGFPNISGSNNALYISYRYGSNLVTKKYNYSTGNWDAQQTINIGSSTFNGLDNIYDNERGLHFVYSVDGSTHYYRYPTNSPNYTDLQEVSDQADVEGLYPTVTLSSNNVHVSYHDWYSAKTRDKNLSNNNWENTQEPHSSSNLSAVHSGSDKLFSFSLLVVDEMHYVQLWVNERDLGSISWAGSVLLGYSVGGFPDGPVATLTNTIDSRTHILYFDIVDLVYRFYEESEGWSDEENFYNDYINDYDISSSSK